MKYYQQTGAKMRNLSNQTNEKWYLRFSECLTDKVNISKCISMSQTKQFQWSAMYAILSRISSQNRTKKFQFIIIQVTIISSFCRLFFSVCLSLGLVLICPIICVCLFLSFVLSSQKRRSMKRNIFCHIDNHLLFSIATHSKLKYTKKPNRSTVSKGISRSCALFLAH